MRIIALILILLNLGFLAWQMWLVPEPEITPSMSASLPGLVLLDEIGEIADSGEGSAVDPADSAPVVEDPSADDVVDAGDSDRGTFAVTDEVNDSEQSVVAESGDPPIEQAITGDGLDAEVEVPEPPALVCRTVGPFTDQAEARRAAALLAETDRVPVQRVAEGEVWLGHWIYIPAFPNPEQAQEMADSLERSLVQDFYVIRNGEMANAISLGVYSEEQGAEMRLAEMRALNIPAQMSDRYRSAPVYWLDFAESPDDPLPLSALRSAAPGRVLRSETSDCGLP